ncbi:DNA mismatch repair protein [Chytridiales sp. JEL 0842]|nr:DNA mismatch repair protein [Chytridiales sp. JEL 0842]
MPSSTSNNATSAFAQCSIRKLPDSTIALLRSSLFTASMGQIALEIVQNSVDAHAANVEFPVRQRQALSEESAATIQSALEPIFLICPHVTFLFTDASKGVRTLTLRKCAHIMERFTQLYGRAVSEHLEKLHWSFANLNIPSYPSEKAKHCDAPPIKLEGIASTMWFPTKAYQFIYVNNHLLSPNGNPLHQLLHGIYSKSQFAKQDPTPLLALQGLCPWKRKSQARQGDIVHPMYCINISCPPEFYDLTLDPEKNVVEFADWDLVLRMISSCIYNLLLRHGLMNEDPHLSLPSLLGEDADDGQLTKYSEMDYVETEDRKFSDVRRISASHSGILKRTFEEIKPTEPEIDADKEACQKNFEPADISVMRRHLWHASRSTTKPPDNLKEIPVQPIDIAPLRRQMWAASRQDTPDSEPSKPIAPTKPEMFYSAPPVPIMRNAKAGGLDKEQLYMPWTDEYYESQSVDPADAAPSDVDVVDEGYAASPPSKRACLSTEEERRPATSPGTYSRLPSHSFDFSPRPQSSRSPSSQSKRPSMHGLSGGDRVSQHKISKTRHVKDDVLLAYQTRLNAETGNSYTPPVVRSLAFRQPQFGNSQTLAGRATPSQPNSKAASSWVKNLLNKWKNPVFKVSHHPALEISKNPTYSSKPAYTPSDNPGTSSFETIQKSFGWGSSGLETEQKIRKLDLGRLRVVGQADRKFIICALPKNEPEGAVGIVVIDQHAADERVRLEVLLSELYKDGEGSNDGTRKDGDARRITDTMYFDPPISFMLTMREGLACLRHRANFERWGIEFDGFLEEQVEYEELLREKQKWEGARGWPGEESHTEDDHGDDDDPERCGCCARNSKNGDSATNAAKTRSDGDRVISFPVRKLPRLIADKCFANPELVKAIITDHLRALEECQGGSKSVAWQGSGSGAGLECPRGILRILNSKACRTLYKE